MKRFLMLLAVLMLPTAQALSVVIQDQTESYSPYAQVYENDNNSDNYIKSVNIEGNGTALEPFTLGEGLGYTIQLDSDYHVGLSSIENDDFLSYWFDYVRYYMGFIIILIMAVILWRYFYKGY